MTIAPKIAIDHFNSAHFRVTVSHPEFGMFEQWIDKTPADDMDGGVTAARIEKEAEKPTARDFARAEFARHANGQVAARMVPEDDSNHQWLAVDADATDLLGPDAADHLDQYTDFGMAQGGWSPVRECPDPEAHDQADEGASVDYHAMWWQAEREREQAEKEQNR